MPPDEPFRDVLLSMKPESIPLPEAITVPRTDPIYNCHAYLTKVPVGAIQPFIQTFTKPGEVVVDFFAGSGMTGLAALMRAKSRCPIS